MTPIRRLADAGFSTALLEHVISRLDPLDDYSGFASLLVNLQLALGSVRRNLPALLSAPLLQLLPVLAAINAHIRQVGIGKIATSSDSGRDGVAVTDPAILARHLLNKMPVAHGVALLDPESRPQFQPAWAGSSQPTLEQLHGILSAATNGFTSQQIAERWLMTEQKVGRILDVASMLAKTCRYDGYLIRSIQSSWYANVPEVQQQAVPKRIPNMPSGKRAGDTLERFVVAIRNLDDPVIREGLFAWSRCFRSAIPGLACDDPLDLKAFWNFLRRIGYDEIRLVVAVPVVNVGVREELKEKLREIGVPENSVHYMSPSYLSSLNDKNTLVPAILIKRTKDSKVESASCPMVSVHQYCYLCLIALGALLLYDIDGPGDGGSQRTQSDPFANPFTSPGDRPVGGPPPGVPPVPLPLLLLLFGL